MMANWATKQSSESPLNGQKWRTAKTKMGARKMSTKHMIPRSNQRVEDWQNAE